MNPFSVWFRWDLLAATSKRYKSSHSHMDCAVAVAGSYSKFQQHNNINNHKRSVKFNMAFLCNKSMTTLTRFHQHSSTLRKKNGQFFLRYSSSSSHETLPFSRIVSCGVFFSNLRCCCHFLHGFGYDNFICNMVSCAVKCQLSNRWAIIRMRFFSFAYAAHITNEVFHILLHIHASANVDMYGFHILYHLS